MADHRRELFVDRHDEALRASEGFALVASFNPGYRRGPKDLKPSTRQRFVAIGMHYPDPSIEAEIVARETGTEASVAKRLVTLATKIRTLDVAGLAETASTRLLVAAARLVMAGVPPRAACRAAIVEPLTDDAATIAALGDLCDLAF